MKLLILSLLFSSVFAEKVYVKATRIETDSDSITSPFSIYENEGHSQHSVEKESSLYISSTGAYGGADTLKLRGTERGYTKIMLDDIELGDPTDINRSFQFNLLNNLNIDETIVLKGPQSTHYGSDAVGGIIKLNTNEVDDSLYKLRVYHGSNRLMGNSISLYAKKNKMKYKLLTSLESTDGVSSYSRGQERDFYRKSNFYGVVEAQINSTLTLKYSGLSIQSKQDIDDFGADRRDGDLSIYKQNTHQVKLTKDLFYKRAESSLKLTRSNIFRNSQGKYPSEQNGYEEKAEIFLNYFLNEFITPSFLVEASKENASNISDFTNIDNKSLESYSISANANIAKNKIRSQIGLRHIEHSAFENFTSYKLGLSYLYSEKLKLFSSFSRNFVLPTVYQAYYSGNSGQLRPTTGFTKEVGVLYRLNNSELTLSLFENEFENQIDYDSSANKYLNIKESQIRGGEIKLAHRMHPSFQTTLSTTIIRSEVKDTGKYLGKSPRLLSTLFLKYMKTDTLSLSSNWRYVGERNDSGRLPSHLVGDIAVNYKAISLKLNNILDKSYENSRSYQTLGRNYMISLSYEI